VARARWNVSLKDLLDAGLLHPNQKLRLFKDDKLTAHVTQQGSIRFQNESYRSPTAAAHAVRHSALNGWVTWQTKDETGEWISLAELRKRLRK
jgi:hypothetical protein